MTSSSVSWAGHSFKSVMGFRQFLLRGLENVQGEWTLVTMAWNMKRMLALAVASGAWPFLLARK